MDRQLGGRLEDFAANSNRTISNAMNYFILSGILAEEERGELRAEKQESRGWMYE